MRTGIARLVEVDHTTTNVALQLALQRGTAVGDWREVTCADVEFFIIFEEKP
jgi:hypothetical protein